MTKFIYIFLLTLFSSVVNATETDLYKKVLLDESKQQILLMQEAELDEFRNYLSSCGTSAAGEIKRFFCERSARAYILKYGQQQPVEKLIMALAEVEFLIDLVDQADDEGQASAEMKNQVFRDLDRYIIIRQMMEAAIKKAYERFINHPQAK